MLALEVNVKHPDVVYKQAILETGWFKSRSFLEHKNAFGMKRPRVRKTTAIGKALGHAKYDHWFQSVIDYKYYQEYYDSLGFEMNDYYSFLEKAHYSSSKNYIKNLKKL